MLRLIISLTFFLTSAIQLISCHSCKRKCIENEAPKICHYDFTLDLFSSMSTDCNECPFNITDCFNTNCVPAEGSRKGLYLINKLLPGPMIEVCEGDRIVVDLRNELLLETTSIHWHGVRQKKTPFMDGVPYVTQCPIAPGHSFRYDFVADEAGTYWWHSHSNEQRGEGMFGALIVRSNNDTHNSLYDRDEHVIVLTDWTRITGGETLAMDVYADELVGPHTLLVNGLGRYMPVENENGEEANMPLEIFKVQKGMRHRFRIIHAGVQDCPVDFSIDNHTMLVINVDSSDIEPIEVDAIRMMSGERYDIVVTADQQVDNYWMRFRGKDGSASVCAVTGTHQVAVLRYDGAPEVEPQTEINVEVPVDPRRRVLNPYNKGTETPDALTIPVLNSLVEDDETSRLRPDHQFYLAFDDVDADEIAKLKTRRALWQINNISFKPSTFPLLTQPSMIVDSQLCNETTMQDKNCSKNFCACTYTIHAKLNSLVELVIVGRGARPFNHPVHLHGYKFRVVAMQKLSNSTVIDLDELKKMDEEGKIHRKLKSAPLKDTVMVPSGGYTIVRFYADNPGYWFFHCHYEIHADVGMALVIKVGEHQDFRKPPHDFPKCGKKKIT